VISIRVLAPTLLVAVLTTWGWRDAARAAPVEPPRPSLSAEVQAALENGEQLRADDDCAAALAAADRALELAKRLRDNTGKALAHRSRALCLVKMRRSGDAIDSWKKALKAWKDVGYVPGQIEALAQASHLYCDNCTTTSYEMVSRALRLARDEQGHPLVAAQILHEAGHSALERNRLDIAHRLFAGAVEIRERYSPNSILLAESLIGLGRAAGSRPVTPDEAQAILLRAHDIAEAVEPEGRTTAEALFALAKLAHSHDRFQAASDYGRQAIRTLERIAPESMELSRYLGAVADSEIMLGDLEAAERHLTHALEIRQRLTPDGKELSQPLTGLGFVHLYSGDLESAKGCFARSLEISQEHGEDPVGLACSLINMGIIPTERQDFAAARRCYLQVLALLDEHAPDHPNRAMALGNLAEISFRMGDSRAAADYARQALPLFEQAMPGSIDHSMALTRMGMAESSEGDYRAAVDYHRRALAIREQQVPNSDLVSESLMFMASDLIECGELKKAERYLRRAFEIISNERANMTAAQIASTLGQIEREKGNFVESESMFEFAVVNWSNYGGAEHPALAPVHTDLAWLYVGQGRYHEAIGSALRSESIHRNHVRWTARSLPEREALEYGWSTCDAVLSLADAYVDLVPEGPSLALDAVIRSRAIVLDEVAARHRMVAASDDPEIARLAVRLNESRERLARLTVRGPGADGAEAYRVALNRAIDERQRAEDELAYQSREFRATQARARIGLEDVIAELPEDSALVSYVRYNRFAIDSIPIDWGTSSACAIPAYAAMVVRRGAVEVALVNLGEAAEIERLIADLRRLIDEAAAASGRSMSRSERSFREAAAELRRLVWDPITQHLDGVGRVIVVPDGSLNLVNLVALPVGDSNYLIETGPRIHHLSVERDLVGSSELPTGRGVLVLGDPAFDEPRLFAALRPEGADASFAEPDRVASRATFRGERSACPLFRSLRFEALPSSGREAAQVIELWRHSLEPGPRLRGISEPTLDTTLLTGPDANEASLKTMATGRSILHLATHGFFLGRRCLPESGDALRGGVTGDGPPPTDDNPLLLAGLALAGANHRDAAGPEEEDGILTAEEIAALDLTGVEWAVLSACDTGVGEASAGEGVFGMRRAFQVAGARTLIMSLWQVEDEATHAWMDELYTNRLVRGLSTIDSVHAASLALLDERRSAGLSTHPFYWAGFIASGDWR
jgi:CHAT domain-containing protein/Tfp pilus assembly protein PilF